MFRKRNDTIFALSSAKGPAAIAVIRVSGPQAAGAFKALSGLEPPQAGLARRVRLVDPESGEWLDDGLALWFLGPRSSTGEDVLELHVHGGRAVIAGVIGALARRPGLRPAEPGEFSRRAFENGKLDLTAAEAIADLVDAETAAQRRQALRQMDGGLARRYDDWRERLTTSLAHMEADIDFPDEGLPEGLARAWHADLEGLRREIGDHLDDDRRGERIRDGFYVTIVGAPNVGKSSLLNQLARRDAAIVSSTKGTTRDVIEVHLDLEGFPVILADTAGLRESSDGVEGEGVRRARARAEGADLRLAVFDASALPALHDETLALVDGDSLPVVNKWDLAASGGRCPAIGARPAIAVSARTGAGIDGLIGEIGAELGRRWSPPEAPALTRVRHRRALEECRFALERALKATLPELAAEDARLALRALGRITGRVDVEDVLDAVFRDFCIGK